MKTLSCLASLAVLFPVGAGAQAPRPQQPPPPNNAPQPPPRLPAPQPPGAPGQKPPVAAAGSPLPGLDRTLISLFAAGRAEFEKAETVDSGLGPIFNDNSCGACHRGPALGGASPRSVTQFGRMVDGKFDPMVEKGGPLLQDRAIHPGVREIVPTEATLQVRRQTTPVFGLGLVEAIPDSILTQLAARPAKNGVKGRAALVTDPVSGQTRVGRFGWKSQHASLSSFSADAYLNEMGVTNRLFPSENAPNGNGAVLRQADRILDPEDAAAEKPDFELAADFMRLLAPLPTLPLSASAQIGRGLFETVGCADCHVPVLRTGAHSVAALANQPVALYSDLLLHDMGPLGDGMPQGAALGAEMRTSPLWGLRASAPYLHDGRAATVEDAIRAHEGQGKGARDRYAALSPAQRKALLDFLGTL
jgi:CxxC motif-containing protein (DUF1111 family)